MTRPVVLTLGTPLPEALREGVITTQRRVVERLGSESMGVLAVGADGRLLVSAGARSRVVNGKPRVAARRVGYLEPGRNVPTWVRPKTSPPKEPFTGDLAQGWSLWGEGASTEADALDMDLVSHHDRTGRTRALATSHRVRGRAVSIPGYNRPLIAGDRAYWADVAPDFTGRRPHTAVYSRALDGHDRARVEALGAYLPSPDLCSGTRTPTAVVYARSAAVGAPLTAGRAEVRRRTVAGSRAPDELLTQITLPPSSRLADVAACGDVVAYVVEDVGDPATGGELGSGTLVVTRKGGVVATVRAPGETTPSHPVLVANWLAFASYNGDLDGGQWLLDLRTLTLYRLPVAPGLQDVRLRGDQITWREEGPDPTGPNVTVVAKLTRP